MLAVRSILVLVVLAVGCRPPESETDPWGETARIRGAFDFRCPSESVHIQSVGGHAYHAEGCGRTADYVCDGFAGNVRCVREAPLAGEQTSGGEGADTSRATTARRECPPRRCCYRAGQSAVDLPDYGLGCRASPTAQVHNCTLPYSFVVVCQSSRGYRFALPPVLERGAYCPPGSIRLGTVRMTCEALVHPAYHACIGGPRGWERLESWVSCASRSMVNAPGDFVPEGADPLTFLGNQRGAMATTEDASPPVVVDAAAPASEDGGTVGASDGGTRG